MPTAFNPFTGKLQKIALTSSEQTEIRDWLDDVTLASNGATTLPSLTLASGATVTEFSIDGTLAGNSDTAVPTEQAVKTYADGLGGGGDLKADGTVPLTADWDVGNFDITLKDFTMDGNFLLQSVADSTTAVQVNANDGSKVLNVDTTNKRVSIGNAVGSQKFEVCDTGTSVVIRVASDPNQFSSTEYYDQTNGRVIGAFAAKASTGEFRINNFHTAAGGANGYIDFMIDSVSAVKIANNRYTGFWEQTPTAPVHAITTEANRTAIRVGSTHATAANRYAGIEYLDNAGLVKVFTGLRGSTNEFRFNNIASGGYIDLMVGSVSKLLISNAGNIGFNSASSFGTNANGTLAMANGTAPTTDIANQFAMWSADRGGTAGKASPHFRCEDGSIWVFGDFGGNHASPLADLDILGLSRFGDSTTNYTSINSTGDLSFVGSAGFYPVRLAQSAEPAADTGEMIIWRDTDDGKVYIIYNDADSGQVKIELI
uniref:Uncharacterized protein n=1 Tax=viral metagenome TaxID=1070528 RepID=A0A6M3KZ35_9ZZZZ